MPSFIELPNETLYTIIDNVHPDDIIDFSLCCKRIRLLAKNALSLHLQRKNTYKDILLHGCHRHAPNAHPLRLIWDICMDWRVGEYPKSLVYHCCHHPGGPDTCVEDDDLEDMKEFEVEKKDDDIICQKTMQCMQGYIEEKFIGSRFPNLTYTGPYYSDAEPHLERFNARATCDAAKDGNRDAMLALLLFFVPNLQTICLTQSTWSTWFLQSAIEWISSRTLQRSPGTQSHLMKLSEVRFLGYDNDELLYADGKGEDFEAFFSFAALPSMQTIFGDFVEGRYEAEGGWKFAPHMSNVTEVILQNSAVNAEFIANFLVGVKALKRFTYHHNEDMNESHGMKAHRIAVALLQHAKHSLEYLEILGKCDLTEEDDNINNQCLCGFDVLKELRLDIDAYIELLPYRGRSPEGGTNRKDVQPLVYVLPPAIETASLHGQGVFGLASSLLVDFVEEKDRRLPKLNKLNIVDHQSKRDQSWAVTLREMCENVGVTLEAEIGWYGH